MEITLNLPELIFKKIKVYAMLSGLDASDIESSLVGLIDVTLTNAIKTELDMSTKAPEVIYQGSIPYQNTTTYQKLDITGVADGLGDDDIEEDQPVRKAGTQPRRPTPQRASSLTDEELEHDMDVDDPEHEAKGDAGSFAEEMGLEAAEDVFSQVAGLPPLQEEYRDGMARTTGRRRQNAKLGKRRGKVTPLTGEVGESEFS